MTQLIIAGVEVVLPQAFSVTVKRENSFFTKNGEYTYDCTLRLDNRVNQQLYGFLHRLNKSGQVATRRTAILMADGHVYCRGTEIVTKWTDQTVSIQIVSGESELNYFVGQEQKIEDLILGSIDVRLADLEGATFDVGLEDAWPTAHKSYNESDYCLPTINVGGTILNRITTVREGVETDLSDGYYFTNATPQPYLCALLRRILEALHYNMDTATINQIENTPLRNLFIVNTVRTEEYAKMVPGWTVKDFLTEVERLTGIVFITDNTDLSNLKCSILLKTIFYQDARQIPLNDVVDEYQVEVESDDSREAEFTSSDVSYSLPDGDYQKLMKLPDGYLQSANIITHQSMYSLTNHAYDDPDAVHTLSGTGRYYVVVARDWVEPLTHYHGLKCLMEVDQFRDLDRANTDTTLELKITPAPMDVLPGYKGEVITLGENLTDTDGDSEDADNDIEQRIKGFERKESQAGNLYCAFFNGTYYDQQCPIAYTDAAHAYVQNQFYANLFQKQLTGTPVGSLRLADLDADYYQGGYQIDTQHAITFETFDPNHIDVRQVYVIGNKRYVVRDVEETITAEGRQPMWRVTCYPITISDEAIENRWILTRGVWDDGGAWLDDGRWNDSQP